MGNNRSDYVFTIKGGNTMQLKEKLHLTQRQINMLIELENAPTETVLKRNHFKKKINSIYENNTGILFDTNKNKFVEVEK